ncbi:hypothetical protein RND81_07G203300 [Saponaria officinalis]|uniref:Myb-like domain-containing protein n=1 Tax=Saponaria officinalis TaxID=3572 RepID=A0AAW1JU21_SAPOF
MYISDATTDDDTTTTTTNHHNDMMIEIVVPTPTSSHHNNHHHPNPTKKRAETWVQEETRNLINLRREMDSLFNTSKSNKHLWEEISLKMRERGFDRSPTMCTDKWRNLLKEFKKVKHHHQSNRHGNGNGNGNGNGSAKMSYYKEIDEILRERSRCSSSSIVRQTHLDDDSGGGVGGGGGSGGHSSKVDSFLHFSDKGIDDASIPFGPMEANGRSTLNLERGLDHEGHPLAITVADAVNGGGVPPSFWRGTPGNGDDTHAYGGRVINVKWGDYTRRIGVDGTADAIKDVIRSAFGLRTRRAFWLEDEDQAVRSLDRDMPLGTYTLHLDEGMTIKLCHYEESDHIPFPGQTMSHTEEKTFYTEEDFRDFMNRRGWSSLRELSGYRNIDNLDDLRPDALYRGVN